MVRPLVRIATLCTAILAGVLGATHDAIDWPAAQPTHVTAAGVGNGDAIDWP